MSSSDLSWVYTVCYTYNNSSHRIEVLLCMSSTMISSYPTLFLLIFTPPCGKYYYYPHKNWDLGRLVKYPNVTQVGAVSTWTSTDIALCRRSDSWAGTPSHQATLLHLGCLKSHAKHPENETNFPSLTNMFLILHFWSELMLFHPHISSPTLEIWESSYGFFLTLNI